MSIERAIGRFEAVMGRLWPSHLAELRPGVIDAGLDRLREAVAPYAIPAEVEALYRWRDGGDRGIFGGWHMWPLGDAIDWYRIDTTTDPKSPRTWLSVFDDQIVNVVTLDIPGRPASDTSVWYGHTHDAELSRLFDSIEALLNVVCDAAEAGVLVDERGRLLLTGERWNDSLAGLGWTSLRLHRSPTAYGSDAPGPPGPYLSRFPAPDWPTEWLLPLGVTEETLAPRGATHTIAELVAAAATGQVQGTIRGTVTTGSGGPGWWQPTVKDETGELVVFCDASLVPINPWVGSLGGVRCLPGDRRGARDPRRD